MRVDFEQVDIAVVTKEVIAQIAQLAVRPTLRQRIIDSQREDPSLNKILDQLTVGPVDGFSKSIDDGLLCQGRLCVPAVSEIKNEILTEAHNLPFSIHPGGTKMYQDLKQHFRWRSMKKDIAEYVSKCLVCQQVKDPRQKTAGLLQPLSGMEMEKYCYGLHCRPTQDTKGLHDNLGNYRSSDKVDTLHTK